MRSALFVVVTVFLLALGSSAQVASVVESSSLEARPHFWRRVLRNQSTSSLVAYTVGCNPKRGTTILQDALMNGGSYVIPGRSVEADVNDPSICDVGVRAAIFSDGHVEGDPEFVGELFAQRSGAYKALEETTELLTPVYAQHAPLADVIERLKRKSNGGKTPGENGGYSFVLLQISQILTRPQVVFGLPPDYQEQKQPQPSIEDVMNAKGVSRDEARVIILNKRLEAWKSLLENNLQPRQ
jgi:hypothetical protein